MICLPPAKHTAAVRATDHWALLVLTILVLWPRTAVQHQGAWLSRRVAPLGGSVALAPPSVAHAASGRNIGHRTYGHYPNGQMSWFNKDANGGTSLLENNTGDVYFYLAGGQLNSAQSRGLQVHCPPELLDSNLLVDQEETDLTPESRA